MAFAVIVACSPPAPTLADRFDPRPADHRSVPDGALRLVGGAPWGPAPENTLWRATDLVWLESGRWATGGGTTWTLWDPALGWVRSVEAPWSARPTPDGAWLAPTPVHPTSCTGPAPGNRRQRRNAPAVRFDPDVSVDRRREADAGSVHLVWDGRGAAADDLDALQPPRTPGCVRSWTAGGQLACANTHTLTLLRGEKTLAHWSLAGEDTYNGPSVSVGWSADGRLFAWRDGESGLLTAWADGADLWSVQAPGGRVHVSPDGSLVLVVVSGAAALYDAGDGTRLDPPRAGEPTAAAIGPGGQIAARYLDRVVTWDAAGAVRASWPLAPTQRDPSWEVLTWGADGICVGGYEPRGACFDPAGGALGTPPRGALDGCGEPRTGFEAVSRDGTTLTLRSDGALVLWPAGQHPGAEVDPQRNLPSAWTP